MTEEFNHSNPIYLQLADRIQRQILRGELKMGEKLPSVREMAVQSGVNPNTVGRTYQELERMGVVESKRGQGTFVTENEHVLADIRQKLRAEHIHTFIEDMQAMGFTAEEIIAGVGEYVHIEGNMNVNEKGESDHD